MLGELRLNINICERRRPRSHRVQESPHQHKMDWKTGTDHSDGSAVHPRALSKAQLMEQAQK